MNNDLISREALKKVIGDEYDLAVSNGNIMLMSKSGIVARILAYIDNAPTVEVTEEMARAKLMEIGFLEKLSNASFKVGYNQAIFDVNTQYQRPKGEWKYTHDTFSKRICDKCNYSQVIVDGMADNFCPNCGAQMKGGAE